MNLVDQPDRFVRETEVARITALSRTTRWRLERDGKFPRRRRISANSVAWLESELVQWLELKAGNSAGEAEVAEAKVE